MIQLSLFGGVVLIAIVAAPPAAAQPHLYVSATTAVDAGERGNIPGKTKVLSIAIYDYVERLLPFLSVFQSRKPHVGLHEQHMLGILEAAINLL